MKNKLRIFLAVILTTFATADIEKIAEDVRLSVANEAVQVYVGKVGKLPAIFSIEWAGKHIFGSYFHPSQGRDKEYILRGLNPRNGVLELNEFTVHPQTGKRTLSARINLNKKIVKNKIIWSGTMFNTDGRKFAVSFERGK